jgi:acyl carrier protein
VELRGWLAEQVGALVGIDSAGIEVDELLAGYGLDSVHAAQLSADVEQRWGVPMDPSVTWDHPTISELAEHLRGEVERADAP